MLKPLNYRKNSNFRSNLIISSANLILIRLNVFLLRFETFFLHFKVRVED